MQAAARTCADISTLEAVALAATRSAAVASYAWVGRNDQKAADAAATTAMRTALADAPGRGTVVIGEGEKDDAPMLFNGETVGNGHGPDFDIAVDPLEGTSFCARDLPGSLATIAFGEAGTLWSPGPGFYMDKIVVPPRAKDVIDLDDPPERTLAKVARALGKEVGELRVVIMDKPRHKELIARVLQAGAAVQTPAGGDVGGSLAVLLPTLDIDLLLGVGGTPEGIISACAVSSIGGVLQARLHPRSDAERAAAAGIDLGRVLTAADLVCDDDAYFVLTGITDGDMVAGVRFGDGVATTDSLVIQAGAMRSIRTTVQHP